MAVTLGPTGVTFPDSTEQTTAATLSPAGETIVRTYTAPATWSKPAGLIGVSVFVLGSGGGGAGARVNSSFGLAYLTGGGGGSGGIVGGFGEKDVYMLAPVIPGPVTITVGSGGAGGPTTTPGTAFTGHTAGSTGGTTSFGPFISVTGGAGGQATPAANSANNGGFGFGGGGGAVTVTPSILPTVVFSRSGEQGWNRSAANTVTASNIFANGYSSSTNDVASGAGHNIFGVSLGGLNGQFTGNGVGESPSLRGHGGGGGYYERGSPSYTSPGSLAKAGGSGNTGLIIVTEYY